MNTVAAKDTQNQTKNKARQIVRAMLWGVVCASLVAGAAVVVVTLYVKRKARKHAK